MCLGYERRCFLKSWMWRAGTARLRWTSTWTPTTQERTGCRRGRCSRWVLLPLRSTLLFLFPLFLLFILFCSLPEEFQAWIPVPTSSKSAALLKCWLLNVSWHPGAFKSVREIKYKCTQTAPLFFTSLAEDGATRNRIWDLSVPKQVL